ncbi:PcfB family protein [Lachnospiraceae bacterium PAL227]|uniref:PcfB family protein n=1 Tax=Ohessyouella blattaphilus TaxID=2949333 RepID=A0ABT1EG73_9FIRM|nr:PcfB family protein [Ohessyouella blattaphilus]MCP1109688.1 PcfB family protein [Ohessyouella blattaphilus]MCR8563082.1 PcfB family protein [Ohessyouella blattaphilus]
MAVHEQVNDKAVAVTVQGAKLTGRLLAKALQKFLAAQKARKQKKQIPGAYKGKQTVKQLVGQNAGVTSIDVSKSGIRDFERYARKYGVDFALKKDSSTMPPKWIVFFKARDADAMTAAFSEFTAKTMKRSAQRPSVVKLLRKMVDLVKNQVVDRQKHKERGGPEL